MIKNRYACQECGHISAQWFGKCPACDTWNSLVEEILDSSAFNSKTGKSSSVTLQSVINQRKKNIVNTAISLNQVSSQNQIRWRTGMDELDRVLGGGAVEGSIILICGDPGIGKSTLLLQALDCFSQTKKVLYVTGEESLEQVKLRAQRLGIKGNHLLMASETGYEQIMEIIKESNPDVLALDSIQTMYTNELQSAPGSVSQVKEVGARFMHLAKQANIFVILIGHVTKDGSIAGPRVLEHLVDSVLYFEGSQNHSFRILRGVKNRFGSTNEIGVFEMTAQGLKEVKNPSELFLAERQTGVAGSVAVSSLEGTRPVLVELQALVTKSNLPTPRRTVLGVDAHRAAILLAVMEKKLEISLFDQDVFLNVVGGVKLTGTSSDLGIIAVVASSFFEKVIPSDCMIIGEVGLAGEVRAVSQVEARLKESINLGFKKCFLPKSNFDRLTSKKMDLEMIPIKKVQEMMEILVS